jgi:hypothetical protein
MNTYDKTENGSAREVTKIQIFRFVAKDKILDLTDLLAFDPKRSKIAFTLVEFDEHNKATQRVRHYVDADDMKLVCHDLLGGTFTTFEDQKGSAHDDYTEARVLSFKKEAKYRQPYVLRIDNGQGEVYGQGQVKMVKATDSLTIQMPEFEARKLALVVLDYIHQWEMIHFRKRQDARTVTFTPSAETTEQPSEQQQRLAA